MEDSGDIILAIDSMATVSINGDCPWSIRRQMSARTDDDVN